MKALSVKQPWAELIASGSKTIETRKRPTKYRGPVLICASKTLDLRAPLLHLTGDALITGCAIAVVSIADCRRMLWTDKDAAMCRPYPGAHSWVLKDVRRLRAPFPVRGQLGLFNIDIDPEALDYV